jgi:hypothetical protein
MPFQGLPERLGRASPMRILCLPVVTELADRPLLTLRHEDRVEAEAARAPGHVEDAALEDSCSTQLLALGRDGDELADVTRSTRVPLEALELRAQPLDVLSAGEAGRLDARAAAEALDLEAGVLAEDPMRGVARPAELRLGASVLVVGRTGLGRVVVRVERLDLPTVERTPELAQLARILRGEPGRYGFQRAPRMCSALVRASISSAALRSAPSRTRRSMRRRSPSSSNSRALT